MGRWPLNDYFYSLDAILSQQASYTISRGDHLREIELAGIMGMIEDENNQ